MSAAKKSIIFFDSECIMCNKYVTFVIEHEKHQKFYFAPVNGLTFKELQIDSQYPNIDSIILYSNGTFIKSTAVLNILMTLSSPFSILARLGLLIPRFFRDLVYDTVAKYRYKVFGTIEACSLIPPESRERILD